MCNQNQAIAILSEVYAARNPDFGNVIKDAKSFPATGKRFSKMSKQ